MKNKSTSEKEFKQVLYYLKKHNCDMKKSKHGSGLFLLRARIITEKRCVLIAFFILTIGLGLSAYSLYEIYTYNNPLSYLCFIIFISGTFFLFHKLREEMKCFHDKFVLSRGTSKKVRKLFKDVEDNYYEEFIKYLEGDKND